VETDELLIEASYSEYLQAQDPPRREACFDLLDRPRKTFVLSAKALAVRGRKAGG